MQENLLKKIQRGRPDGLRYTMIALAVSAIFSGTAVAAEAGDEAASDAVMPTVTVTGQAASMNNALDVQQVADNIVSAVSSDGINQLPDANAAEALQRVPGVSVELDQGEGRYVSVRGTDPNLNAVNINGMTVPSPESGQRAVALDVLPSSLVSSVQVSKTLVPSQDANSLGGTVDVKTISAFDHEGFFASGALGGTYDSNLEKTSPEMSATVSDLFMDKKLGVAIGVHSSERQFGSDNVETGGGSAYDSNGLVEFERRDYTVERKREGGVLNLDYKPSAKESYFMRTTYSRYSDYETRQSNSFDFGSGVQPGAITNIGAGDIQRAIKDREETQEIASLALGGERNFGDWKVGLSGGFSESSEENPDYLSAKFESNTALSAGYTNSASPQLIGDISGINDPSNYTLDKIEVSRSKTTDKEGNIKLDLERKHKLFNIDSELKFGAKLSRRKKTNNEDVWSVGGTGQSLADYTCGTVDYALGSYGPAICAASLRNLFNSSTQTYEEEDSRINDYTMHEDINAAYLQNNFNLGLWRVLVGTRYEQTKFSASGTIHESGGAYVENNVKNTRDHWLPAIHVRRDLDANTAVRAAWTNSVIRPTFEQLAPGYADDGSEIEFGNPNLKPTRSSNLDLGIERRLGFAGVLSTYVFYKKIKDFVYATDVAGTGAWTGYSQANTWENGNDASMHGMEVAFSRTFRELPGFLGGLIYSGNGTWTHSSARINGYSGSLSAQTSRDIRLPGQSDFTMNQMIGYQRGPWDVRLAFNYKSRYLSKVTDVATSNGDQYVDSHQQWDFSMKYAITKNVQAVFEVINLNDEPYYVFEGNRDRNVQYETYGRTFKFGLRAAL